MTIRSPLVIISRSSTVFVLSWILLLPSVAADPNDDLGLPIPPVVWQAPFADVSPDRSQERLLMVLITDGDAMADASSDDETKSKPWCDRVLGKGLCGLFQKRPDLCDRMVFQHLPVGTPAILTGGRSQKLPNRAMLVILDHRRRLLAWMVGVPESEQLIALAEDAEEVQLMDSRFDGETGRLTEEVASRSVARLDRRWAAALSQQMTAMNAWPETEAEPNRDERMRSRLGVLASVFRRVYVKDVALRFGLTEKLDRRRLAILEQHPEARRPWCESMIPFVACLDFESVWRPMVEAVWNCDSVSGIDDATELLTWWDTMQDDQSVVLSLRPPLLDSIETWPPADSNAVVAKRGLGWDALTKLLKTETYREVTAYELSLLLRDRNIGAIDVRSPSRVRYLYFESTKEKPVLIRELDVPGRHVAFVKRHQK